MKDSPYQEKFHIQVSIIGSGIKFLLQNLNNTNQVYQAYLYNIDKDQRLIQFFQNIHQLKNYMEEPENLVIDFDLKVVQIVALMNKFGKSKKIPLYQFHLTPLKINIQAGLQNVIQRCGQYEKLGENQIKDYFKLFAQNMIKFKQSNKPTQQSRLHQHQLSTIQGMNEEEKSILEKQISLMFQKTRQELYTLNQESFQKMEEKIGEFEQKMKKCDSRCQQNKKTLDIIIRQIQKKDQIEHNVDKIIKAYSQLGNSLRKIGNNLININNQTLQQNNYSEQQQQSMERKQDTSKNINQIIKKIDIQNWINKNAKFHERLYYKRNIIFSLQDSCSAIFGKNVMNGRYSFIVLIQKMARQCSIGYIVPQFQTKKKNCLRIWNKIIYRNNGKILIGEEKTLEGKQKFQRYGEKSEIQAIIDTKQGSIQWKLNKIKVLKIQQQCLKDKKLSWVPYIHAIGSYRLALTQITH